MVTVASGGDDGQLTVSTIKVQYPQDEKTGGSRGSSQISESLTPVQIQFQHPSRLLFQVLSQYHVQLAHAAPLTALKPLRPGLVVSTSADQRVCLWRVGSAGISHIGALCSHVADAAGLAVWEEQITKKTGFESEQEIAIWSSKGSQTGIKTKCNMAESETADEDDYGKPVEAVSETRDPDCKSNEAGGETAECCRNQTETIDVNEAEIKNRERKGWVLVCGQGFQLLRLTNSETDAEMWTAAR